MGVFQREKRESTAPRRAEVLIHGSFQALKGGARADQELVRPACGLRPVEDGDSERAPERMARRDASLRGNGDAGAARWNSAWAAHSEAVMG